MLVEILPQMSAEICLERLLAGNKGKTSGQLLGHKMTSATQLVLIQLGGKVLDHKLAS